MIKTVTAAFLVVSLGASAALAQNVSPPDNAGKTMMSEPTGGNQPIGGNPVPVGPGPAVPTTSTMAPVTPATAAGTVASPASAGPSGGK